MAHLREASTPAKGHLGPEIREVFDQMMEMTPDAPGIIYEETSAGQRGYDRVEETLKSWKASLREYASSLVPSCACQQSPL
jgi:hypothetical protein